MTRRKRPDPAADDIDLSAAVLRLQMRCAGAECERDAANEELARARCELDGTRKAVALIQKGMESQCDLMDGLKQKVRTLEGAVRRIEAACGMPDPADGCREVLRIAREVMGNG